MIDLKKLRKPFPQEAIKQRDLPGEGGKQFSYVAGHTVIHRLNDAVPAWDFIIKDIAFTDAGNDRKGNPMSLVRAHVALTLPGMGTREHIGVQMVRMGSGEDLLKGAITDGLKKAATLFGVGLELYGPDFEDDIEQADEAAKTGMRAVHAAIKGKVADNEDDHDVVHTLGCSAFGVESLTDLTGEQLDFLRKWIEGQDATGVAVKLDVVRKINRSSNQQALTAVGTQIAQDGLSDDLLRKVFACKQRAIRDGSGGVRK